MPNRPFWRRPRRPLSCPTRARFGTEPSALVSRKAEAPGAQGRASQYAKLAPGLVDARVPWLLHLEPDNPPPESGHHQSAGRSLPRDTAGNRAPVMLVPLFTRPPTRVQWERCRITHSHIVSRPWPG